MLEVSEFAAFLRRQQFAAQSELDVNVLTKSCALRKR